MDIPWRQVARLRYTGVDVTDGAACDAAAAKIVADGGPVDYLINNAGYFYEKNEKAPRPGRRDVASFPEARRADAAGRTRRRRGPGLCAWAAPGC